MEQQFASLDIYGRNKQLISVKTEVEENCYMETTPTPLGTIGYAIPEENKDQQFDVVLMELPVRQSFIKLEDSELLFSVLSNEVNVDMSPQGQKERKYIKLLFNIKYGTNPRKETAWRVLAQEAREFDSMTLMNPILRLLRQLTWEDEGIDSRYADEHVKNVTAITLSVVASALGVPALLPFLMEIGEVDVRITSPISEYTLTRAGGADTLMGSINFENEPIPDEKEPNDNAMPPNEQPHYWTDYLALEQERYNQRLQWV
ncbi:Splicing factor 3B subunit 1 [Camellia lanceoleosa]|nr:Splicing factor 3B subunit 1 [Camellia lanceoleosa]